MKLTRKLTRRQAVGGFAALTAAATLPLTRGFAQDALPLPSSPVTINVVDVAGNLALTQVAIENYAKVNPHLVSRITFTKAPAPELPGKLRAQQAAGRLDIDMVLTGTDAHAAGLEMDLWTRLLPDYASSLPDFGSIFSDAVYRFQGLAADHGVVVAWSPGGPLLEYMPDKLQQVPKNLQELLDWTRANPNKFIYARPANSGPGRTFLMGIPYILQDSDPSDPLKGWDKTWDYLKELHKNIEYYPTGTSALMKELGEGTRDMTVSTMGWDINPRVLGVVPKEAKIAKIDGFHWISDGHYICVPKGISQEKLAVLLDMTRFLLTPEQQAYIYDNGYHYPGPVTKDVPLSLAPQASQEALAEFGRPEYADWIENNPIEMPLSASAMVAAFRRWDEEIAAADR